MTLEQRHILVLYVFLISAKNILNDVPPAE
jgi:hypothetical protein